jgi:hypothetical protein
MTITITLADANGGTELLDVHEGLPPSLSPTDKEIGWRMVLAKLGALTQASENTRLARSRQEQSAHRSCD